VSPECELDMRFYAPPAPLRRFFTTFYFAEWTVTSGGRVTDHLLPEWANLRFHSGSSPEAVNQAGMRLSGSLFAVTGPSSEAVRFTVGSNRMWGVGILPLGWAKFVRAPAHEFTNAVIDGNTHPAFVKFADLAGSVFGAVPDEQAELARIVRYFEAGIELPLPNQERIIAIHAALVDVETTSVQDLVERSGTSQKTVERICRRDFGFSPKLLLRRQRFMRSLAQFVLDPSLRWIGAMDSHYHDQSQFVRDFHQFMGMTPRHYAALDKPLVGAVMRARARSFGSAVQILDGPGGMTFSD
jgi:AraC-like DNA-binding protein